MELREYQKRLLSLVDNDLMNGNESVLAACPNSGKTTMILDYMKTHNDKTFLILTHGTLVLKTHWQQAMINAGLEFSEVLGQKTKKSTRNIRIG